MCRAFLESERARLLKQSGREANLPNVMDEPTQVCEFTSVVTQAHATRDVTRVDRDGG